MGFGGKGVIYGIGMVELWDRMGYLGDLGMV